MPILPGSNSCGGSEEAEDIFDKLVEDGEFDFPEIDFDDADFQIPATSGNPLYVDIQPIDLAQLTNRTVGGPGVFDALMDAMSAHLKSQYEQDRITGREYADVYTAAIQGAMQQAVGFLMGKDNAYWQAIATQANAQIAAINAVRARIDLENSKLEYFTRKAGAKTASAEFAVKKMQLALMDQDFCQKLLEKSALQLDVENKKYTNDNILPLQRDQISANVDQIRAVITGIGWDNQLKEADVEQMLPKRIEMLDSEMQSAAIDRDMKQFQMDFVLPAQRMLTEEQAEAARAQTVGNRSDGTPVAGVIGWDNRTKEFTVTQLLPTQHHLLQEQVEGARAQTLNTRTDGVTPVVGLIGKQKDLYTQQIESYQRDAEVKAAKMFIDSWVTQKTIDEGLLAPTALQNASIETVMQRIKTNNGLNV